MMQSSLATKLRVLRAQRGLTLRQAAALVDVRPGTLSELERGLRHPHDVTLSRIAKGYGVPVEDLLEESAPLASVPSASPSPDVGATGAGQGREERLETLRAHKALVEVYDEKLRKFFDVADAGDASELRTLFGFGMAMYLQLREYVEESEAMRHAEGDDAGGEEKRAAKRLRGALAALYETAESIHDAAGVAQPEAEVGVELAPVVSFEEHQRRKRAS